MKTIARICLALAFLEICHSADAQSLCVSGRDGNFPLVAKTAAAIYYDSDDYKVVEITAGMLSADVERVTGLKSPVRSARKLADLAKAPAVVAGTVGSSALIDELVRRGSIDVSDIQGKWESYITCTVKHPVSKQPLLVVAGSDRRGTAFGLTSLSRTIGVSPWYWWADVAPSHKDRLYIQAGRFIQDQPSVKYRGIFINDERFGGWAHWVEKHFDAESGKVGPKVYEKVFELLLRLKANYLWPAMHNGSQAFNKDTRNAVLADDYAIVMGTSHCEQMLRNNEDEWKNVGTYGDFNYITNRETMKAYWEERVKTNGAFENTYTLGLRGIHDYPMEGANTTEQRRALMQQAIQDQRDMLKRNISKPLEEIPQVLCTYEEVLDAYHSGLEVPDDVIMLWSDDKQGYTRNLSNPEEMKRAGGAGLYYHLSYHGDPASWIWLSPLSPAFVSNELCKAYEYGARKIWIFNVGDIKPAEKEISFVMDLAWDVQKWKPQNAHEYIRQWASETFGEEFAGSIASIQEEYYRLMAYGKDSHVWFLEYTHEETADRLARWQKISDDALELEKRIPDSLKDAYFQLVSYPVVGACLLNHFQLCSRRGLISADKGDYKAALADGKFVKELYERLNQHTRIYNEEISGGKWRYFFSWVPYQWYYETSMFLPVFEEDMLGPVSSGPKPCRVAVDAALGADGAHVCADAPGRMDLWIKARTHVRNFSKSHEDNIFCHVQCGDDSFDASAKPINNVWHSPYIGPMWSKVGEINLKKGDNVLKITDLQPDATIVDIYLGLNPPLPAEPLMRVKAADFTSKRDVPCACLTVVPGLGYCDGVTALPTYMPSFDVDDAPYLEYTLDIPSDAAALEIRTLPTLHVYEGRGARYAVQVDDMPAEIFSIHEGDFTSEWRLNVLRGYATRKVSLSGLQGGTHKVRIYLLDPGMVMQEILVLTGPGFPPSLAENGCRHSSLQPAS